MVRKKLIQSNHQIKLPSIVIKVNYEFQDWK